MVATSQYSLPKTSRSDDPRGKEGKIREAAKKYGIDPDVAVRVAKSEGLRSFKSGVRRADGTEEPSYGAFQLYTGGGLGNKFQKETGLDPADPNNEDATIDFAMKEAKKSGWGPWHGAKNTGIGQWEGISGGAAVAKGDEPSKTSSDYITPTSQEMVDTTQPAGTGSEAPTTATAAAPASFTDKLAANAQKSPDAVGDAVKSLGQVFTGSPVMGQGLYNTAAATTTHPTVAATPLNTPQVVPVTDPNVAAQQRQQLASALQRLNSGKLY